MLVRCRRFPVVGIFAVALVVGVVFVGSASGQNAKDCEADKTCTVDPKKTATTTLTTMEPKKASMTTLTTMDPKKATVTTTTMDPKKATVTTTTMDPKKYTTTMDPKKATTTTTTKNTLRTQVVNSSSGGSDGVLRRYNISGKDSDYRSANLTEIVVLDVPATADADRTFNSSGNASISVPGATGVKPDANKTTEPTLPTNVIVTSKISTPANNSTTTESTRVSRPNTGVQVVRFTNHIYCDCDLTYFSCDINCCCDGDCTNHDLKTFTMCSEQVKSSAVKPESILFDSSLFYVVIDNVPSDYFYPERDAIQSESQIGASLRNRDVFTWHDENSGRSTTTLPSRMDSAFNSYDLTYKSSRWMYTIVSKVNSSETKTFSLKNSALNSLCSVEQPVEYLVATNTSCQRFVPILKDVCNNDSSLGFKRYFSEKGLFKVVRPNYSSTQKTEKFGLVAIQATAHHLCVSATGSPYDCRVHKAGGGGGDDDDDSRPHHHPVYVDGVCRRAVDAVEYRVTHNGTGGVRKLDVHFYHRDVTDPGRPVHLGQTFRVRFGWAGAAVGAREPYARSGKPGYATGSPVLVTGGDAVGVVVPPDGRRPRPMDLPEPDAYGTCDRAGSTFGRRRPVNFLENVEVRCHVVVRPPRQRSVRADEVAGGVTFADFCHRVQNETIAVLGDFEGMLVASLGDPDVAKWIPTVVVKPPAPPPPPVDDSTCPSVIDGVRVLVLYSHVGTFDRPQATVLGVSVNYTASATRAAVQGAVVPIRASVVFQDLTRPPVRTFAEPPTYEFRLPEDFYYPFWSTDSSADAGASTDADAGAGVASAAAAAKIRPVVPWLVATFVARNRRRG